MIGIVAPSFLTNKTIDQIHDTKYSNGINNGIYLVLNKYDNVPYEATKGKLIHYSHEFLGDNTTDQPKILEIDSCDYVPLKLSENPHLIEQPDQKLRLQMSLTDDAALKLEKFTEKHLNKEVAIVISGRAVTMHKVRSKIEGGKIQITRCTDNACKHLFLELKK